MVTLTSHEQLSPEATIRVLPDAWNKLRLRLLRKAGKVEYLIIPERHEDMRVHLHALVLARLGKKWWKDNARSSGMGYMAEDKPVYSPDGAGHYVGKYLAKQLVVNCWAKGFHRIRTSQGWPKLPLLPRNPDWEFDIVPEHTSVAEVFTNLRLSGYAVRQTDHREAWQLIETGELLTDNSILHRL